MKFARYLEETQTPEWKKAYIDYRGLKKRITAIRRAQDATQDEQGSTTLLPLTPSASVGADGAVKFAMTPSDEGDTSAVDTSHVANSDIRKDHQHDALVLGSGHSNTGTSSGVLPRLRRRSTAASAVVRSQCHPQLDASHIVIERLRKRSKIMGPQGVVLPLIELLPLLSPEEHTFLDMLDHELDKVESFYCNRERELRARYEALREQLQALKDHRHAFYEAHPLVTTRAAWLPFVSPFPLYTPLRQLRRVLNLCRLGLPFIHRESVRRESEDDAFNVANDGGQEEKVLGDRRNIHSPTVEMRTFSSPSENGAGPSVQTGRPAHVSSNGKQKATLSPSSSGSKAKTSETLVEDANDVIRPGAGPLPDPEEYRQAKKTLRKAVQECYRGLEVLHNYRYLNLIGFRKALKKFEKVTHIPVQQTYTLEKIEPSAFASGTSLDGILRDLEEQFAARFARGDKKKAQAKLRGGPQHKSHHFSTFRTGLLLGLAVPALVDGLYKSFQPEVRAAIPSWDGLLFVYGIFVVPTIFSMMIGLNLLVWHKSRINYVFIFELDLRTRLDYREYFEIPALLLSTLCYALWLSFSRVGASSISPSSWPLLWLVWTIAIVFNPFPILFRSSRYWLLRNIARQLTSGARHVEFQDFWMGDQFCSLVFTLGNLWFVGCAYSHRLENWRECTTGRNWAPAFALASLPFLVRFVQSIKRWMDSRLITHLVNAGKYGTGIVYYLTYYLWRAQGGLYGTRFVIWCILGVCYATYATAWDLLMDWSLMRPHAKYRMLRTELIYTSYVPLYYVAMITNVLIRFEFIMYIPDRGVNYVIRTFIAAMCEMLRRWQWNFYRLENEHVGNMDQYRVTREVPLPYSLDDPSHDSDGGDEDEELNERLSSSSSSWRRRRATASLNSKQTTR